MTVETQQTHYGTAASRWAGVGPYYAMFPVGFATAAVKEYTKPGDCVFDPFAGRATSLFAAVSEGRVGLGIEINPVGWVYGKAKLQTAEREEVEDRIQWLGTKARNYRATATKLPQFFDSCFCSEVQKFLLAARDLLDWRRTKSDWTTMALLMIDLHGKRARCQIQCDRRKRCRLGMRLIGGRRAALSHRSAIRLNSCSRK